MNRLISTMLVCLLQVSLVVASTFNLRVEVTPNGAGTLNSNGGTYEEGSKINLRTYSNTGFVFKGWFEGETLLSTSTSFSYTMPSNDALVQAKYDYDPSVPENPAMPDTTTYYLLTANVSPLDAGSLNLYSGKYAAGAKVYLRTNSNTGFQFVGWQNNAGETVSSSTSFNYTMPSHDTQLTALYVYDPSVPANPDSMGTSYSVSVTCKPVGGGTFNTTNTTAIEGGNVHLYAYTNTGYKFLRWENEKGEILSTAQNFYYVIPHGNSQVYGIFEFDPAVPSNPNKNYWNKDLGEVIVDDFSAGSLSSAVSSAISGNNRSDVAMITVAGKMNNNDFGIANDYTNCTLLDLSRVTGISEIPSYAFDYTNLESVYLPATIEKIGYRAFYSCQQLSSLIVYAMTPPTLESNVFTNVPEGLVIYVPAAAIAQYQEADGWKDFTILPIQEDIRSISVSLPNGVDPADFARMWLELTNTKSGQRMHYVLTDRSTYIFQNIIRNTSWNIVLRNERGDIFGQIDNVEVKDEDVSVSFTQLSKPQNLEISVLTPDGKDVTDQIQITWVDVDGNYLSQSSKLSGLPVGFTSSYRISLSQELAMLYDTPSVGTYTFKNDNNQVVCRLAKIANVTLSGIVKDASTNIPLSGAIISASQTFGGKYSKTVNTTTAANGQYSLTLPNVPTTLAIAAPDHVSQTFVCDSLMPGSTSVIVPTISLKEISGAVLTIGLTYTACPTGNDDEDNVQEWYSDYNNISYSIYNKTKRRNISQFNVQYPQIVLLETVDDGDVLELTATSRVSAFMPVISSTTVQNQRADIVFNIVELGKIQASFSKNGNASVVGSLYDEKGKLIKTYNYTNATLTIEDLADGNYTLVTMGSSTLFNTIYDLVQLPQTGLSRGVDYVQSRVEVKSGNICSIDIAEVPTLNESKLYYTGRNTSFTVNKSSIVVGNYLTLTGHIDFKPAYATSVSNVQMIVDLPESCQFVENSVMVGNSTSSYTINGNRITIPLTQYTDRVRFCVIPTLGGNYAPSAFAQFDLNGKTITQPIGSANYTANDLSISVPTIVAKTTVPISGTAIGTSVIDIYDNGILIGQTTSLANGLWTSTCKLDNPYNLSTHSIYAKVMTNNGLELLSETKELTYDMNAIQVQKVTMYHDNPEQHTTYEVVFDFLNPSENASTYVYYIYNKNFTFTVDFTNNDPEKVSNVVLYVKTGNDGKWTPLRPIYDKKKATWVATGQFGNMYDGNIPVNVKVGYEVYSEPVLEARLTTDMFGLKDEIQEVLDENDAQFQNVITQYDAAVEAGNEDLVEELIQQLTQIMGLGDVNAEEPLMNDEEVQLLEELVRLESDSILSVINNFPQQSLYLQQTVNQYMKGITIDHAPDNTPEQLIAEGYEEVKKTDGSFFYVLIDEDAIHYIDFSDDIHLVMEADFRADMDANTRVAIRRASDDSGEQWLEKIRNLCEKIEDWCSQIMGAFDDCVDRLVKVAANNEKLLNEARRTLANKKKLHLSQREVKELQKNISKYSKNIKHCKSLKKFLNEKVRPYLGSGKGNFSKVAGKAFTLFSLASNGWECYKREEKLVTLHKSITAPCKEAELATANLKSDVKGWIWKAGIYYTARLTADIAELAGFSGGLVALIPSGGSSTTAILAAVAVMAANIGAALIFDWRYNKNYNDFCKEYRELYKLCDKEPCDGNKPCPPGSDEDNSNDNDGNAQDSGNPDSMPQIDPSGFVYEGVFSNRLEGVTATAYYKEEIADMYGDLNENIVKWNAEEYAQENPLFTDENGYYRWDVPQGLWQVKFEKEGYETTYSDWLPVPPPQLDINIAMKQNVQPNVKNARAYGDAVEIEFDKYMMPEYLTTDNIVVMCNNNVVEGTVVLLNEEVSYEGASETFASKVRFNAAEPFDAKEVTLIVNNRVRSYAGIRMQDYYSQTFDVELEAKEIVCDANTILTYGENGTLAVRVLPASAATGKTLYVKTSSPMILGVDEESVTLDNQGQAIITITGNLPGTAALTFSLEGYDLSATTIVNIEQKSAMTVANPSSNIASGSIVERGTAIYLSCETEGATIYYTLDGSCPCDESSSRKIYDGTPIIINDNVNIKVWAIAPDMYESDVIILRYVVEGGNAIDDIALNGKINIYPLPVRDKLTISTEDNLIKQVTLNNVNGSTLIENHDMAKSITLDVSHLSTGIYIINIVIDDKLYSKKIIKTM